MRGDDGCRRELATLLTIHRRLADPLGRLDEHRSTASARRTRWLEETTLRRERLVRLVDNRIRLAAERIVQAD